MRILLTCWRDRREHVQAVGKVLTVIAALMWTAAVALAQQVAVKQTPLTEHANELMPAEMYVILALVAGYVGIISYVYLSNIRDIKESIRANQEKLEKALEKHEAAIKKKVSIAMHNTLCEKQIPEEE